MCTYYIKPALSKFKKAKFTCENVEYKYDTVNGSGERKNGRITKMVFSQI